MDIKHITTNRILAKKLISLSRLPTLDLGIFPLMFDLVSLPLYMTSPKQKPYDAITVFCHKVFSKDSGTRAGYSSPYAAAP